MAFKSLMGATCACLAVVSFSADAALVSRLGGLAFYDDVADLTWLVDANAGAGTAFDTGISTTDDKMTWQNANDWAAQLTVGGVAGWRLATTLQPDPSCSTQSNQGPSFPLQGVGTGCTGSEMGNLFYNVLGGVALTSITTTHNTNYDLFSDVQSDIYWSGTEFAPNTEQAWDFAFITGVQVPHNKGDVFSFAWAVQSGDVSAVPVPAAAWLFGSGLLGLIGVARRKKS